MTYKGPYRSILITGASSGIGAALARTYSGTGVRLALSARNADRLEAVAVACRSNGADVRTALVDVRDADAVAGWVTAEDSATPIDLAIACAGITGGVAPHRPMEKPDAVRAIVETNLLGALNTVLPALAAMQPRARGRVAMVGSLAGLRGLPYSPAYCAAKAALAAYAQALRGTAGKAGLGVTMVLPGFVDTPLDNAVRSAKPFRMSPEKAAGIIKRGLARGRRSIVFPRRLYFALKVAAALPDILIDPILRRAAVEVPEPEADPDRPNRATAGE